MTARRRTGGPAGRILATLLDCEPTEAALLKASLRTAIGEGRAQRRGRQAGATRGNAAQRENAQTFAAAIGAIRQARPRLKSDAAAIRVYLVEQGETPTKKTIESARRRLTRARARK